MKIIMRAAIRCSLILTAITALSDGCPAKANLIRNGGFETGDFTGWTCTTAKTGSNLFVVAGEAHSGTYAASFGAYLADLDAMSQTFATIPGTLYHLSFWLKNSPFQNEEFRVTFDGLIVLDLVNFEELPYTQFNFTCLATANLMTLEFAGRNGPSFTYLDDVSVTAMPDGGSTVSILGCALLGLAAVRRKLNY